jgi:hypothetical protein
LDKCNYCLLIYRIACYWIEEKIAREYKKIRVKRVAKKGKILTWRYGC